MTRTISISAPSPASLALQALAVLLEINVSLTTTNNNDEASPKMLVQHTHPLLTSLTSTVEMTGWLSCIKHLSHPSVLWENHDSVMQAQIEAWILAGEAHLLRKESLDADGFCAKIEEHLLARNQTYLVGDLPTAADVCLVIWICVSTTVERVPQQCHRWLSSLVQHPSLQSLMIQVPLLESSPLEKSVVPMVVKDSPVVTTMETPVSKPREILATDETKEDAPAPHVPKEAPAPAPVETMAPPSGSKSSANHDNSILAKLDEFQIEYTHYDHETCMTAEELVAKVPLPSSDETHTKNLFLKDKKHGLFLVTVMPTTVVNTKSLGTLLGLSGKTNLRLADEDVLKSHLSVQPGCVGPLSIVNDDQKQVTLVLDLALLQAKKIHSHPLYNNQSVSLTPAALQEYLNHVGAKVMILDFTTSAAAPTTAENETKPTAAAAQAKKDKKPKAASKKGETLLALQWKKEENFAMWYSDVIVLSEMISYYDISGCYILRPWSYKIWELIQEWFNVQIQEKGVENSYFPLFVSQDRLEREKDHVEGFAPEVAWVTRSGKDELAKPIAVRPTSETIMYPAFSDWIKSHRDLPLKLNQWSNVVRWEFKDPTPFLRSREFLWQEGHTAHATFEDADTMVMQGLEWYRGVYEELLAVPVIKGYKTEKEKFAGGYQTTTCEAYIPGSGRAIQGATSHNLGQNFGKMFDISFQDEKGNSQIPWQTSWGLTTRSIGVMIMVHGDDTGLVLPPRIAPLQAVIVPIVSKNLSAEQANPYCEAILADLKASGIRTKYDDRTIYNPGWKYNHWEQKGVPIRIEVGPRDIEQKQARIVIRYNGDKIDTAVDNLGASIQQKLQDIQAAMFLKAKETRDRHLVQVTEWKDFVPNLERNNLVMTPWCGGEHTDWEDWVKEKSREESLQARGEGEEDERTATSVAAKTLCIPFDQPHMPEGTKCIASDIPATCWILWGRSY